MENPIDSIRYRNHKIEIFPDYDYGNFETPRDWDNLGHMVCFHSRYVLGDEHDFTVEEIKEFIEREDVISYPLYLYDHSGITISITPFSCPWDSGQVGYIYVTKEELRKEFKKRRITNKVIDKAKEILRSEVEVYDQYLTGDIYEFIIRNEKNEIVDSCCGFFGYDFEANGLIDHAQRYIDAVIAERDHLESNIYPILR